MSDYIKDQIFLASNVQHTSGFRYHSTLPFVASSKILSIKEDEFIVIGSKSSRIHKYNAFYDKWTELTEHDGIDWRDQLCFNPDKQMLYFYNNNFILRAYNLKTGSFTKHYINGYSMTGNMHFINDELHIIGDGTRTQLKNHSILDIEAGKFRNVPQAQDLHTPFAGHDSIYIKSSKSIFVYNNNNSQSIYEFSFERRSWNKLEITLPLKLSTFSQAVSVRDEQYILFIGAGGDRILIFDLDTRQFTLSEVMCPHKDGDYSSCVTMNNQKSHQLLVHGYINKACNDDDISMPLDMIEFILMWVDNPEMLHIIGRYGAGRCHLSITVDEILD